MMVLSLCRQLCADKIPVVPGKRLGDGSDGEVFEVENDPSKVIKFCVMYERGDRHLESYYHKKLAPLIDQLVAQPIDVYARVYAHEYMGIFSRDFMSSKTGKQKYILYYYLMEKLERISEDESKVFHSILSHEDRRIEKNFSTEKLREMLAGLGRGLDFDEERVIFFCEALKFAPISHLDIHPRNIMKDSLGNFKLIDFDRVELNGV
jgi:serine/threonine protein kinase